MATLFVSDLHLDPSRPDAIEHFFALLDADAGSADALYILGDLFEVWIGDDDRAPLARAVAAKLAALRGITPVFFIHGNRDFLLGERYASEAAMTLLPEATVIDLYGMPTLLMHGDTLCTDDIAYQNYRAKVRTPEWQRKTLALPLLARRLLARWLRRKSRRSQKSKSAEIMDVNADAVNAALQAHGVARLIHGHTHRLGHHTLQLADGRAAERFVLGDWYDGRASVLRCDASGCALRALP